MKISAALYIVKYVLFSQQARGKEAIVTGFYHEGYEEPLLMLMKRRGVNSGLVVKVGTLPIMQDVYEHSNMKNLLFS